MNEILKFAALPLTALIAGLVLSFAGVQWHKIRRRRANQPKQPNSVQQRIAFIYAFLGAGVTYLQFKVADHDSYSDITGPEWVSVAIVGAFTAICCPFIWAWIFSWLKAKHPTMYDMLRVKYQDRRPVVKDGADSDIPEHTESTWFGRWESEKIRTQQMQAQNVEKKDE